MSEYTRFVASNMNKAIYEFRSEVDNHLAPNVTLISSDNVKVKGHSIILASCHYFKELFNKDKTGNPQLVFHENFTGDILEFVVKYIYTAEYSLLDADKLPDVIRATCMEKFNIPALAKGYLLKQLEAPEGLNQANWHIFYKNGIKLSLREEYFNRIYTFLKEHPDFYKSGEFKSLTFNQICKIMKSTNCPFESNATIMEATLIWATENKAGMDKLAELSKICINLIQNGNSNPQIENSPILDQSAGSLLSTPTCAQPSTTLSDPHSTTRKRGRPISSQINTQNFNGKRSNKRPNLNGIARNSLSSIPNLPSSQSVNASRSAIHPHPPIDPNPSTNIGTATRIGLSTRIDSQKNDTPNLNIKRSVIEVYHPPKYSWDSAQLLFFGKTETSEPEYLWSYSFQSGEIKKMAKLPICIEDFRNSSLLVYQDRIYWIGEPVKSQVQVLVWSFATRDLGNMDKAWDKGPKLTGAKCYASTLLFQNSIYLFSRSGSYNSGIEKWDISEPETRKVSEKEMFYHRNCFGVALLNNVIYMIGGYGGKKNKIKSILDTVESYNIDDGTQSLLPNLKQARSALRVVTLKDRIYAIGGLNNTNKILTSVESYKPGESSWTQVAHMNQPRAGGNPFVLDDKIYVIGKNGGEKPTMERWTMVNIDLPRWAYLYSSVLLGPNNF